VRTGYWDAGGGQALFRGARTVFPAGSGQAPPAQPAPAEDCAVL